MKRREPTCHLTVICPPGKRSAPLLGLKTLGSAGGTVWFDDAVSSLMVNKNAGDIFSNEERERCRERERERGEHRHTYRGTHTGNDYQPTKNVKAGAVLKRIGIQHIGIKLEQDFNIVSKHLGHVPVVCASCAGAVDGVVEHLLPSFVREDRDLISLIENAKQKKEGWQAGGNVVVDGKRGFATVDVVCVVSDAGGGRAGLGGSVLHLESTNGHNQCQHASPCHSWRLHVVPS